MQATGPAREIDRDKCAICLEAFQTQAARWGDKIAAHYLDEKEDKVEFRHLVHARCLNKAFKSKQECPICRQKFTYKGICLLQFSTNKNSHEIVEMKISRMTPSILKKVQENLEIASEEDLLDDFRTSLEREDKEEIKALLKRLPVDDRQMFLEVALSTATEAGCYGVIGILLEYHAQNCKENKLLLSPTLLQAIELSNQDIVYYKDPRYDLLCPYVGYSNINHSKIAYLLASYMTTACVEPSLSGKDREPFDDICILMRAAKQGNVTTVKEMLKENRVDDNPLLPSLRSSAILNAVDSDQIEVVDLLLLDHNSKDPFALSTLKRAAQRASAPLFHLIYDKHQECLSYPQKIEVLTEACHRPTLFIKKLKNLLESVDVEQIENAALFSALNNAAATERKEILEIVSRHIMDGDSRCKEAFRTWLDSKAEASDRTNFEVLLESGMMSSF